MQFPFHVASVAVNGSVLVVRYTDIRDCVVLAGHLEGGAFKVPVNMMIVDSGGEAVRVVIGNDGFTLH